MLDARANRYESIMLSSEQEQMVTQFHVTQQLGFKPVLHCPCGAMMDMNLPGWSKRALHTFHVQHADCRPFKSKPS